jgi:hypothetical protein
MSTEGRGRRTGYGTPAFDRACRIALRCRAIEGTGLRVAAARLQAGLPLLVWYWLQLPVVKPRLSNAPAGRMIQEQLWLREAGRLRYRRAQGVLFLPATFSQYLRGRHRQAVRTNAARARDGGMTVKRAFYPIWSPGPDDCRAGHLTPGPVERWSVIDATGAMVADSVLTVDCETALLQGLVSTASYARWLLHTAIVERLCGECTLLLTNSDDVPLLSTGNQHFQRLLGYTIVRVQARRSWAQLAPRAGWLRWRSAPSSASQ